MIIAAVWTALVQIVGFASGGYVAGRVRNSWSSVVPHERHFRDGMHGMIVWAVGLLIGAVFAVTAAGGLIRTGAQAGATLAAGPMARTGGPMAGGERMSMGPADHAIDYLMRPSLAAAAPAATPPAATPPAATATPPATTEAAPTPAAPMAAGGPAGMMPWRMASAMELRPSLGRIFSDGLQAGALPARDRSYLAALVAARTNLPQAEAEKRVDEAFQEAKNAEMRAREAADKARKATALAAFLAAATLAVGLAAAAAAATLGGRHRDDQTEVRLFGTKSFW